MTLDMKQLFSFFYENECTSRVSANWRIAVCEGEDLKETSL